MPGEKPPEGEGGDRLAALEARIRAAREARNPKPTSRGDLSAVAVAWRMVTELVLGCLIGAGMGWGIDGVAGTGPIFLLVFGLLGFVAGVRTMMRSAAEMNRRAARAQAADAAAAKDRSAGTGAD